MDALIQRLKGKLVLRGTHAKVPKFCNEELTNQSVFQAVTESVKLLMDRIRPENCTLDGVRLTEYVFGTRNNPAPRFINDFSTPAEQAEHFGFVQLLDGIYGYLRNNRSHGSRMGFAENELDFLDAGAMISYTHRGLDRSFFEG